MLAIACLNLLCVSECMYLSMCIYVYVCMYDVRHDIHIPCTRYVAINRLYLYLYLYLKSYINMILVTKCLHNYCQCIMYDYKSIICITNVITFYLEFSS